MFRNVNKRLSYRRETALQDAVRTQSVSIDGVQSTRSLLTCGVSQRNVLGPVFFLVYCADVIAIT